MKKEFGKWLLDVAKYLATAVVLSSVFGELEKKFNIYFGWSVSQLYFIVRTLSDFRCEDF